MSAAATPVSFGDSARPRSGRYQVLAVGSRLSYTHAVFIPIIALALTLAPQPAQASTQDVPLLNVGLGYCSASFTVKSADGSPTYSAVIHTKMRYGLMGLKRMDLELSTNSDGKATIKGLPAKARPLAYEIYKNSQRAAVEQDLASKCESVFDVSLK